MDNQDDVARSLIPTAGYINKPASSKKDGPNKKVIIIVAAILLSAIVIFAIVFAIIQAVIPKNMPEEEPAEPAVTEKIEEPGSAKIPEKAVGSELEKEISVKTNRILSYGAVQNSSTLKHVKAAVFYTENKISNHFAKLSANDKMTIIVNFYRNNNNPSLTDKEVTGFGQESCQLLFNETNCKQIKNNIKPEKYLKIQQTKQKLEQKYVSLFGKITDKPSTQLAASCPYFTYIKEIDSYVFRINCGLLKYSFAHFYQYRITQDDNHAYSYFVGAVTEADEHGRYTNLYGDLDKENLVDNQGNYLNFELNSKNYESFQHYRLVFDKTNSGYIYNTLEKVDE